MQTFIFAATRSPNAGVIDRHRTQIFPPSALRLPKINLHATSQQCVAYHLPDLTLAIIYMRSRFGAVCMALPINSIPKVVCCSWATTRPAGQGQYLRIARVARKPCVSLERRDVSTVYPICTYLNAERARCPIPRKVRCQAKPK